MRAFCGAMILSLLLGGCVDSQKARNELYAKTNAAIAEGRGTEAVQLARQLTDNAGEFPDYQILGRAYLALAEERWTAGDRAGASAALAEAVAQARRGRWNDSVVATIQMEAQPLRVRLRDFEGMSAADSEISAIVAAKPELYFVRNPEVIAEMALAYLEIGQPAQAEELAWTAYKTYWDNWKREQEISAKSAREWGYDLHPEPNRYWPGLKTIGRVLIETGSVDEGVQIWGQNFTINTYYTPWSLQADVQEAATAFRKAGEGETAADLERYAEPLRQALVINPSPGNQLDTDGDFDAWALASNRLYLAWSERLAAALSSANPLRAPYVKNVNYYQSSIAYALKDRQRLAELERAESARRQQEVLGALGTIAQYLPALGTAAYGVATNNSQVMDVARQQLQVLSDAEAAQARSAAASQIASAGSQSDTIQMCTQAKGPQCVAADARATAWISLKNSATTTTLPDGKWLPETLRPTIVAYCSNKIAADVARICAAEMSRQTGLAACVQMANAAADQHEGLAAEAVRAAAAYSAQHGAINVSGQGGVLDSAAACHAWQ